MTSRTRALLLTARPKTLAASVVPVLVGTALVAAEGFHVAAWISLFAVLSAMMIQIATNFVNDAIDFVKGADGETRLGEARATQSGWFTGRQVMAMALLFFALAMLFGIPLVWQGGAAILTIGLVSLLMGYAYTGGPFPLAYLGLGDLFVVIFFGLVAVGGVFFMHLHRQPT
jgi:1,4-dihydroxy-2-naphthoate octaprenyltransferase